MKYMTAPVAVALGQLIGTRSQRANLVQHHFSAIMRGMNCKKEVSGFKLIRVLIFYLSRDVCFDQPPVDVCWI